MGRGVAAALGGLTLLAGCSAIGGTPPTTVTVTQTPSTTTPTSTPPSTTSSTRQPPSTPPSLQQAFNADSGSVVRLEVASCDGFGTGSGFLIAPDLVVTAGHVLTAAFTARAVLDTDVTHATLVGLDAQQDVALARLDTPLPGPGLSFAQAAPKAGDPVATIGFTLGGQLSFHSGSINGTRRKVNIDGRTATDLIEHDTAALPGDSGAPLVNPSGEVVGIHDAGITGVAGQRLAISAAVAKPLIAGWISNRTDLGPSSPCDQVPNLDPQYLTRVGSGDLQAVHTLSIYVNAINNGDYARAAGQFAGNLEAKDLATGAGSSSIDNASVKSITYHAHRPTVWMRFTSHQPPGQGPAGASEQTCTKWSLDYRMKRSNGLWLIDEASPHEPPGHRACT